MSILCCTLFAVIPKTFVMVLFNAILTTNRTTIMKRIVSKSIYGTFIAMLKLLCYECVTLWLILPDPTFSISILLNRYKI